jgi:SAM-dependent methyltransferase
MSNETAIEREFYDLRWRETGVSAADQDRIAYTVSAVPSECRSILDVGAGDGRVSHALANAGRQVTAVDISSVALSKLRVPGFKRSCDDLGFHDRAFDLVLCTEMLEHLAEDVERGARTEFARVAKHYILVTVPNDENLAEHIGHCKCGAKFHIWGHRRHYCTSTMSNLFSGFTLVFCEPFGRRTAFYAPYLLWPRQRLAGAFAWDGNTHCPMCHGTETATPRSRFAMRLCDFLNARLEGTRPSWLLALYRRNDC